MQQLACSMNNKEIEAACVRPTPLLSERFRSGENNSR